MALDFQLNRDVTCRIAKMLYDISGCTVVICNEQGVVVASAPSTLHILQIQDVHNNYCEKDIYVHGKVIGKVVIWELGQPSSLIATLAAKFIAILVQESDSCKDMRTLVDEYETIFNFVPAQIWYKDTKNNFIRVNKQVEKDLGISINDFPGRSAEELFPDYAEQYYSDDLEVITSGKPKLGIIQKINTGSNEMRWMNSNKVPIFDVSGCVSGLIALVLDITENRRIEEQRSIWAKIFESIGEAISVTDADNNFMAVNQAFCDATGYSFAEISGKNPRILKSGHHDKIFYQNMWAKITQVGIWQGEIWEKRKDDTIYVKWLKIHQIKDGQGHITNYVATFTDLSEQKAAEGQIAYLGMHDALTGLPNRSTIAYHLDIAIKNARTQKNRVGIISIDLDRFKNINDSLGHEAGDAFLQEIAKRLESCAEDGSITGRFSGDVFFVILPDIHKQSEIVVAINKRQDVIARPVMYGQVELMVTASVGVSIFPEDGDTPEVLIRNADTAMHQAKDVGHNNFQFFQL